MTPEQSVHFCQQNADKCKHLEDIAA